MSPKFTPNVPKHPEQDEDGNGAKSSEHEATDPDCIHVAPQEPRTDDRGILFLRTSSYKPGRLDCYSKPKGCQHLILFPIKGDKPRKTEAPATAKRRRA